MEDIQFFGFVFLICVSAVNAGESCSYYVNNIWGSSTNTMWCPDSCCGDMYDRYCCTNSVVGSIVGIVIGSVFGVILLVSVIVAIFCCLRKSKGRAGQVCQPNPVIQPGQQIAYGVPNVTAYGVPNATAYGVPNATVAYGAPVGYNNTGFVQTTTTTGTAIPQAHMQPNPYAQAPPKYEELNIPPQQAN